MKAYQVFTDWTEGVSVVCAETRNQARAKAAYLDGFEDEQYKDIRAIRDPLLDGMEECEPKDNYWLNEKIRTILVRYYNLHCMEPNEYEACESCCANKYCDYYYENDMVNDDGNL